MVLAIRLDNHLGPEMAKGWEVLLLDPAPISPPLVPFGVKLVIQVVLLRISPWDPSDANRKSALLDPRDEEMLEQSYVWGYSHKILAEMHEGC